VFLSMAARTLDPNVSEIERSLYLDRTLVRMLGMRRTMFVVEQSLAPVVQSACTAALARTLKRQYQRVLEGVVDNSPEWWERTAEKTLAALQELGEATAQELGQRVPELRTQIRFGEGKNYAGTQSIATRMLMQLSAEGKIVRGRPRGSWTSSQYRWELMEPHPQIPINVAQTILVREWLRVYGPGSLEDVKWWTGLTLGEVRRAVSELQTLEVDLGESTGLVLAEDTGAVVVPEPGVALLPALDPTPMGYIQREWFLGPHSAALFDRSGNIGPTIWSDGHIVGGWAQRRDGAIALKLLEDVGHDVQVRIEAEAHALGKWIGPVRVTPRFRTPLERELSA
jgi:hypothetical protein